MRGFNVPCIHCGEEQTVTVNLHNVDEFRCTSCDNEFTKEDVETFIAKWHKVIKWLNSAPANDE